MSSGRIRLRQGCGGQVRARFQDCRAVARRERRCCFYKLSQLFPKELTGKRYSRSILPRTTGHEPRTTGHEPRATNHEPRTTSHESRTTSHESRATSHETFLVTFLQLSCIISLRTRRERNAFKFVLVCGRGGVIYSCSLSEAERKLSLALTSLDWKLLQFLGWKEVERAAPFSGAPSRSLPSGL